MTHINEIGKVYTRPWGFYKTLELAHGYQVKTITVNPGGRLSLQKHFKREEHWVVVKGCPTITIDDSVKVYAVGEAVFIPLEAWHRLENLSQEPATIIETQLGSYLGEDDIVRKDDIYGR
jgi:mannose-6-phosphate isomerase-like protein (cupin superfamily)